MVWTVAQGTERVPQAAGTYRFRAPVLGKKGSASSEELARRADDGKRAKVLIVDELRKRLVLLEEDPGSVSHPVISHFRKVLKEVRTNYNLLYVRFATFSLWLGAYEQSIAILPYALAAPLLFSGNSQ